MSLIHYSGHGFLFSVSLYNYTHAANDQRDATHDDSSPACLEEEEKMMRHHGPPVSQVQRTSSFDKPPFVVVGCWLSDYHLVDILIYQKGQFDRFLVLVRLV